MDFVLERLYVQDKIVLSKSGQSYTCGRGKENEIVCLSLLVSRRHCIFFHDANKLYVTDLESSNGIFINGKIQKPYQMNELYENDIIGIGCSDINPNDTALFAYKVCIIKSTLLAEAVDTSALSKTILNCNTTQRKSTSHTEHVLEETCGVNPINCDTAMPCEIPSSTNNNNHDRSVNIPEETDSNTPDGKQNSYRSSINNIIETRSNIVDSIRMEDDIQIIHTSVKKGTGNVKSCDHKSAKCLEDYNKSDSNDKTFQYSNKSHKKCKNSEKINISIDKDDESGTGGNSKDINKVHTTENISNDQNNTSYCTRQSNFIHTNDKIIKSEDELQITDEDEEAHLAATSSITTCDMTPIKLKKIKQEPKTRFSEIDVVDLSDNEDGIFPYSQLFDIKFGDSTKLKNEIKQENVSNDTEKVGLIDVDDEIIILTDSEDEDNPWLHRLSRSQLVNDHKEINTGSVIIKEEVDFGIWEDDDISNIIRSEIPSTSKDVSETEPINIETPQIPTSKETSLELCTSKSKKTECGDNCSNNVSNLLTETDAMDIDHTGSSNEPVSENTDYDRPKIDVKQDTKLDKQTEKSNDILSRTDIKRRPAAIKSMANKRLVPVIEALHLPPKRSRLKKTPSNDKDNKASKSSEEKSSRTRQDKVLKLKEKLDDRFCSKEEREASKETVDCFPPNKMKGTIISKEEKKMIMEERKQRLKKIAEDKKKLSAESTQTTKRGTAKPRAKVSLKNRGDFLINEQETHASKRVSGKSIEQTKLRDKQSKRRLTDGADMSKESSSMETNICQKENISKDIINNVAASLQESLHVNNIPNRTGMAKKDDSTKDSNVTDNVGKKHSSIKGSKRSNGNTADVNAKVSKLRGTPSERVSVLAQKNNIPPKSMESKLVAESRKSVSFSEDVEIREYEIEKHNSLKRLVGKDAPIPTNKLAKKTCVEWRPKLEEFLLRIFMWNPVWLEEQRYLKSEPPVVLENELQPMKMRYDSFQQYYKVAQPLLLLEVWQSMTKDFEMVEKNMQRATVMCSIVANSITRIPIPSTDLFLTTLLVEVLAKKEDLNKQTHPHYGDLVSFEYVKTVNSKQMFHKVFGYITNMHQTIITDFTHYNKDLRNYVKNPYAVITYAMLTRPLEHDIPENRIQRIRTVTYLRANMRMVQALQYLPQSPLMNLILNPKVEDYQLPSMSTSHTCSSLVTKDKLNTKQLEAVFKMTEAVLKKEAKLCFIHGPPGTGKSKVIVNLVTQILYGESEFRNTKKSFKILVCAPSNAAIDEIVTRLLNIRSTLKSKRFNMVRIGRLETMHPLAKNISVTELAKRYIKTIAEKGVYAADFREEKTKLEAYINSLNSELANSPEMSDTKKVIKRKLIDATMKYQLMTCGKLIDELGPQDRIRHQRNAEDTILAGADIIACTLSSCYTNQMESIFGANKQKLSVCIVDEATQSCEAETLIPLMLGINTLVLVGDPNQLPATVLSQRAKKLGLDQSIFSRMQNVFASQVNNPIIMLDTQYRMEYSISYWPNRYFYNGKLKNDTKPRPTFPFHPYRVLSHNYVQNDDKFSNTTEAEFVANIIFAMLIFAKWENTSEPISVGVLTPYNNQRTIIISKINEKISSVPDNLKKRISFEVNTVDSFQGQERDVIIMSCVRSHGIGFLSDKQRLCVALTRAKHSLILCGNFNTFMRDHMWKALLSDAQSRGVLCNINTNATPTIIKQFIVK